MHKFQKEFLDLPTSSDKLSHHGYHRVYPWFLSHFRDRHVRLLEIGIDRSESLRLWSSYFIGGLTLHGIDRDEKHFEDSRVTLHQVDQSDRVQLRSFVDKVGTSFDVILDDGSHVPEHQVLTLEMLWPLLVPGGVYIVEDIETSYWGRASIYDYDFDSRQEKGNLIAQLAPTVGWLNKEFTGTLPDNAGVPNALDSVLRDVEVIAYAHNCVVLVKKNHAAFGAYYDREYRLRKCVMVRSSAFRSVLRVLSKLGISGVFRYMREHGMVGTMRRLVRKLSR